MGHVPFFATAPGKSAKEALDLARAAIRHEAEAAQGYSGTVYEAHYVTEVTLTPAQVKELVAKAPAQQRKNYREAAKTDKAYALARFMINTDHELVNRSSGYACAIKTGKNLWLLFGWARW